MSFKEYYRVDTEKIVSEIIRRKAENVLIQLPEGVKRYAYELIEEVRRGLKLRGTYRDVRIDIDANPIYGSCLIDGELIREYDIIFHLGHEPYPYWSPPDNVVFVELSSKLGLSSKVYRELTKVLHHNEIRNIVVYTVQQHKALAKMLSIKLKDAGFKVLNEPSVITGCWFSDLDLFLDRADAVLVIAGGKFHALGVGLHVGATKPIIALDPYSESVQNILRDIIKVLKVRLWISRTASNAHTWLIVVGVSGQYRGWIIDNIMNSLRKAKRSYYIVRSRYLNIDILRNVDRDEIDAIVVTSCPRLAIEDLSNYEKPVLTPGELFYALGIKEDYTYPW